MGDFLLPAQRVTMYFKTVIYMYSQGKTADKFKWLQIGVTNKTLLIIYYVTFCVHIFFQQYSKIQL